MISDGDSPPEIPAPSGQPPKGNPNAQDKAKSPGKSTPSAPGPSLPLVKFSAGNTIPMAVKLTVRSLYVLQGLKPAQIAPMCGLAPQQVANLARREGWTALRNGKKEAKEQKSIALQDARASEDVARVVEAVAIRSEELSVRTLDRCSEILKSGGEDSDKKLQMASGAARNFVQIARMSRGLDARTNPNGNGGFNQLNVNLFVVQGETPESMAKAAAIPCEAKPVLPSQ